MKSQLIEHPFCIFNEASKKPVPINKLLGKSTPAFTTNRLYISGRNPLALWSQINNAIASSLYQRKTTLVFDFNPDTFIYHDIVNFGQILPNKRSLFTNHAPTNGLFGNFNVVHDRKGLMYWDLGSRPLMEQCTKIEGFLTRLISGSVAKQIKGQDISVVFANVKPVPALSENALLKTIQLFIKLQFNIVVATSPFIEKVALALHHSGFSKVLIDHDDDTKQLFLLPTSINQTDSAVTQWSLRDWQPATLPVPTYAKTYVYEPIKISV